MSVVASHPPAVEPANDQVVLEVSDFASGNQVARNLKLGNRYGRPMTQDEVLEQSLDLLQEGVAILCPGPGQKNCIMIYTDGRGNIVATIIEETTSFPAGDFKVAYMVAVPNNF
ncbi:MAG: hypothetical protein ACOCU8_00585 [Patescibacteria group bacterium]